MTDSLEYSIDEIIKRKFFEEGSAITPEEFIALVCGGDGNIPVLMTMEFLDEIVDLYRIMTRLKIVYEHKESDECNIVLHKGKRDHFYRVIEAHRL